ncbi:DUF2585 family protein [Afifella pfennigii]|uniref:DUF2585 family protein n=1 Tax=Afifella pfennigii TaxID=209897 RepID=UPI000A03AD95|nr:DUF2585 family protein [Afifella pfennigii]
MARALALDGRGSLATVAALGLILAATAAVLLAMGRIPICACGTVELWYGRADGPGNSQHLTDWYTPSHVIHGFLFYGALWLGARFVPGLRPFGLRLVLATLVEAAWEIAENTPMVIDRYRAATIAFDYVGDTILNSMTDILAMMVGFFLAAWLPVWMTIALAIGLEIWVMAAIRDGLALNILMLLWPLESVRAWQAGG